MKLAECPENLENWNYTVITSKCKGPHYTAKVCCDALKELACPHADLLNDLTTDCSVTMFSYINLYGKYPPGLFANECKEDMDGLNCPEAPPPSPSTNGDGVKEGDDRYIPADESGVVTRACNKK
ncbi:hypothetical protein RJ641_022414 [Dillenia turbinata]|uniref:GPI-anchored protein LLG1-like domain-containing protein n=1 Tax=Dillenia turbinata TaxID=194707 RepID=A0AAN8YX33_9MAGN